MTDSDLRERINSTARRFEENYKDASKAVEVLKDRIYNLELKIVVEGAIGASQASRELNSLTDKLDRLTDSLIKRNRAGWNEYLKLELECKDLAVDPVSLEDLKAICNNTEQLAKDMLCYSLARFKRGRE